VSNDTCVIDGCIKPRYQRRRMCSTHTMRQHRYGDPTIDKTKVRGVCEIDDCEKPHAGLGWCKEHYDRSLRSGDPATVYMVRDDVGYGAAHWRVYAARGSASGRTCSGCGGSAAHWAYDHADQDERASDRGSFSLDIGHYRPMCVPCHKRFDLASALVG
jgi:hypothetical protein